MSVAPNHHPPAAAADPAEPGTLRLSGRWTLRFAITASVRRNNSVNCGFIDHFLPR